ncbi:hypothetical protein N9X61_01955 [Sulfurimonas sp.]|nr:hypothetical protein [Sulfurimonas sp.]
MKRSIFLLCLVFGVSLSANAASDISKQDDKAVSFEAGKNKVLEHRYYANGTLKSFDIASTDARKGTYTEYYENGNLKSFTIIK